MKHLFPLLILFLQTLTSAGQDHSSFPLDVTCRTAPQAFKVSDTPRLAYELHLVNYAPWPIELTAIAVLNQQGSPVITFDKDALDTRVIKAEHLLTGSSDTAARTLASGHAAVIFIDIPLAPKDTVPSILQHRITCVTSGNHSHSFTIQQIRVNKTPVSVLSPPVHGPGWVAFNAYGTTDHRRSFNPVDGRLSVAERFAIDWMCLGPDGKLFNNDPKDNNSYYCYGAEVLAVADARVCDLKDGAEDNTGVSERANRKITLDNIVGNYLTLDLGNGRYALYAHLQPGKFKVRIGDRVKAGQPLALLGNSGNSDGPHLHFQLMDANSPIGSEGIPYVYRSFTQRTVVEQPDLLDKGGSVPATNSKKQKHNEFPVNNAILDFP